MRTEMLGRWLLLCAAGAHSAESLSAEPKIDLDDLVNARSIHCEFYPAVRPADAPVGTMAFRQPEVLVHYAGINRQRTRMRSVSTRAAGARDVSVLRTDKAVHFVEHAAGVFMVTTVFACNQRERRGNARRCLSYGAVNSRHFDASVNWQPDSVFERFRHLASHGFCDHSFVTADVNNTEPDTDSRQAAIP